MKEDRIIGVLIDTDKETFGLMNVPNELGAFYKLLGCSCIDITARKVGKKSVEIICDDEGLFKEPQKISAIDNTGKAQLVGSILIVGLGDKEGNLTSLTDTDAAYIMNQIQLLSTRNFNNPYPILTHCEFF